MFFCGGFRRLRAASSFAHGGKGTKTPPGDGSGWTLRVHIRPPYPLWPFGPSPPDRGSRPRTPFTGVTPWGGQNPSGARNQECLGAVPSGPTGGLCFEKIEAAAVPRLRLGSRTNAPGPFSTVGAHSVRPWAGMGPAPTNRRERFSTRPPDFRQGFRKAAGAALAVARDGYGIRFRTPLQGRLSAARKPSPYKGADSPYQGEMSRSDRGDRDRCPRRGRMRVGSGMAETFHRAGQCPAPTKYKTP